MASCMRTWCPPPWMSDPPPLPTPCRGICRLGLDGLCDGCGRTIHEIAAWVRLGRELRERVMERVAGWIPREGG